jgi:hypothetical protein
MCEPLVKRSSTFISKFKTYTSLIYIYKGSTLPILLPNWWFHMNKDSQKSKKWIIYKKNHNEKIYITSVCAQQIDYEITNFPNN